MRAHCWEVLSRWEVSCFELRSLSLDLLELLMTISADQFRDALRFFPAGVTIVTAGTAETAGAGETRCGLTVSAFTSVSAEPPLIAVLLEHSRRVHDLLESKYAPFAVSFLTEEHVDLSNRFAFMPDDQRFTHGDWGTAESGVPVLQDALAWLDCTVESRQDLGSHILYAGRVWEHRVIRPEASPLVYWNRDYHSLVPLGMPTL